MPACISIFWTLHQEQIEPGFLRRWIGVNLFLVFYKVG